MVLAPVWGFVLKTIFGTPSEGNDRDPVRRGVDQSPLRYRDVCHGFEHAGADCALHFRPEV